jgi:hypothetical protein
MMVDGVCGFVRKMGAPGPLVVKVTVHVAAGVVGVKINEESSDESVSDAGEKVPQVAVGVTTTLAPAGGTAVMPTVSEIGMP